MPAVGAAAWPHIDDVISGGEQIQVMVEDDDPRSSLQQPVEHADQRGHVEGMQAGGGLIEDGRLAGGLLQGIVHAQAEYVGYGQAIGSDGQRGVVEAGAVSGLARDRDVGQVRADLDNLAGPAQVQAVDAPGQRRPGQHRPHGRDEAVQYQRVPAPDGLASAVSRRRG